MDEQSRRHQRRGGKRRRRQRVTVAGKRSWKGKSGGGKETVVWVRQTGGELSRTQMRPLGSLFGIVGIIVPVLYLGWVGIGAGGRHISPQPVPADSLGEVVRARMTLRGGNLTGNNFLLRHTDPKKDCYAICFIWSRLCRTGRHARAGVVALLLWQCLRADGEHLTTRIATAPLAASQPCAAWAGGSAPSLLYVQEPQGQPKLPRALEICVHGRASSTVPR
ncbi:hypothetical protein CC80DRAFT_540453 [Byssothecium circinans]|uniref:Uncharacterized protein n=1 Tax=Byssothecium circinans TaxID=147558 RepID=A0A6A5T8C2_9PLEO|nr:hypothetical protein CC80DRAFT_540453 [Byssothecium circinans]